jgi:O-antigen/teichoic acid export membrane protein
VCSSDLYGGLLYNGFGVSAILTAAIAIGTLGLFLFGYICRQFFFGDKTAFDTKEIFRFGRTTWFSVMLGYFLGKNVDMLIMVIYGVNAVSIGFYQIVFMLVDYARNTATKGMSIIIQSAFSSAFHWGHAESVAKWWRITIKFEILAGLPGVFFLVLFAKEALDAVLPKYSAATPLLQVFGILSMIGIILGYGVHPTVFFALGKDKLYLITMIIGGLSNLILDLIFIYFWGALGALIATSISAIIVGVVSLRIIYTIIPARYPVLFVIKCICCLAPGGIIVLFPGAGLLMLIIKAGVFMCLFIFLAYLFKPVETEDIDKITAAMPKLSRWLLPFYSHSHT